MDDFFDFEDATNPGLVLQGVGGLVPAPHPTLSGYDIDLILDQAASGDGSFASFQQSSSELAPIFVGSRLGPFSDIHMGGADDVNKRSGWISSAEQPPRPCVNCQRSKLDCVRAPAGDLLGQQKCASCIFLSRPCNLSSEASDSHSEFIASVHHNVVNDIVSLGEPEAFNAREDYATEASITVGNNRQGLTYKAENEYDKNYGQPSIRFSRETVRLLRNWLSVHHLHPYPTEDEKEELQQKTGLSKIQITNWLANARRRGQVRASPASSSHAFDQSQSVPSPKQPKATLANMDPMERWEKLPPEHEPASVVDITKAMETSPVLCSNEASPFSYPRSNDGSVRSIARASSISSRNTSKSSHASLGSGLSQHSRASLGQKGRRRRRPVGKAGTNLATIIPRQYQCTFCIETFKTKHDWQRHEKSLHLSLEQWICAPNVNRLEDTTHSCAFCGTHNPDASHYELHNCSVCQERPLAERTFYRKDHLRQHLRLVHECQFLPNTMESWKVAAPEVRSRCGFCGHIMETWAVRTDHLAEHYKAGKSMAHWKGSWGFEPDVQKLVENGMPPYLIHPKRMAAMSKDFGPPVKHHDISPYDRVKARLLMLANREAKLGHDLTNEKLRMEAARCMAEYKKSVDPNYLIKSWFADLIMCSDDSVWLKGLKHTAISRIEKKTGTKNTLSINDKAGAEKYCEFERQLADYVNAQRTLGLAPSNADLKAAGCRILMEYDRRYSKVKSATAVIWICEQIMASHGWIDRFRERVGLRPSIEASDGKTLDETDSNMGMYRTLETNLADFVRVQIASGTVPSNTELQRQARLIIFGVDDPLLQTAADEGAWLAQFKFNHGLDYIDSPHPVMHESPGELIKLESSFTSNGANINNSAEQFSQCRPEKTLPIYSLQDAECCRRLEAELSRFVVSCMSHHSPNPHVPSDDEIRRQARWIISNDDDPRNHTVVDNEEWLLRFKCSKGLASSGDGCSTATAFRQADMCLSGVGPTTSDMVTDILPLQDHIADWVRPNSYSPPLGITQRSAPLVTAPTTSSSWSLESSLADYVYHLREQGLLPSDEQLRAQARALMGRPTTAADDPTQLQRFKDTYGIRSGPHVTAPNQDSPFGTQPILRHSETTVPGCQEEWTSRGKNHRGRISATQVNERVSSPLRMQTDMQMTEEAFQRTIDPQLW